MKRNQCIICFDRIFKKADKISTSHNTTLGNYIKHEGWYHIECLKEYIEHCNKDKIPKCPLCRDDLIIDIPGYNYNIGIRKRKHLFNEFAHIVIDETMDNTPIRYTIVMNVTNILLVLQGLFRYGYPFYMCMYLYFIYTAFFAAFIRNRDNNEARREAIQSWVFLNKILINLMRLELFYSSLDYIVWEMIEKHGYGLIKDETIEHEYF